MNTRQHAIPPHAHRALHGRAVGRALCCIIVFACAVPRLRAQTVDAGRYAWEFAAVTATQGADALVAELRRLVQQVLDSGQLAPISLRFGDQLLGAGEGYLQYQEPGRILTTLAWAYPHVSDAQRAGIHAYARAAFDDARNAPWSTYPASPDEGARRELHLRERNWQEDARFGLTRPSIHTLYGVWLYGQRSGDWSAIAAHWPDIRDMYHNRIAQAALYGTMGAHIAMARMADRFGDAATRSFALERLRAALQEGLDFDAIEQYARSKPQTSSAPYGDMYADRRNEHMYHGWMFLNLCPEIGRYLREQVRSATLARHRAGKTMFPLWWLMQAPYFCRWTGDESVGLPSEITGMMAPVERWVEDADAATMASYCRSAPTGIGDCYWMEMLVLAIEAHGNVAWTDVRSNYDRIPPSAVRDLRVRAVTGDAAQLAWTAPGDDGDSGRATEYQGRIASDSIDAQRWTDAAPCHGLPVPDSAGAAQEYWLRGLMPSTRYWTALRSADEEGNLSMLSRSVSFVTAASTDTVAPPAPTGLSAHACGLSQILLSWSAVSDASGVAWYEVQRDGQPLGAKAFATAFEDHGLAQGAEHVYRVRAVDRGGNPSAWSAPASARTATVRNAVVNGDFERGALDGWQDQGGMTVLPAAAWAGAYGVRMDSTGRIDQMFATRIGTRYHVAARIRIDKQVQAPAWGGILVSVVDTSWRSLGEAAPLTAATSMEGAWTRLAFDFTATSTSSRLVYQNFSPGRFIVSADEFVVSSDSIPQPCHDRIAPAVVITYPTTLDTASADSSWLLLAGDAFDASALRAVRWSNNRGGSGGCTGTAHWSARIALAAGENTLAVTAEDAEGNIGGDTLRVTWKGASTGEAPHISAVRAGPSTLPQWARYELAFSISTVGTRPFAPYAPVDDGYGHPEGITAEARITTPTGQVHTQPAYLHEPYLRADIDERDAATGIVGKTEWRIRYSPMEQGTHRLVLSVEDRNGRSEAPAVTFTAGAPASSGFVRVSKRDRRVLVRDDGSAFIPIAEGRQWAPQGWNLLRGYDAAFASDAAAGVNLTRVWDQNDGFNLALEGCDPRWLPVWSQFSQALRIDTHSSRSGLRSARFSSNGLRVTEGYTQRVAVLPSTAYTLSGWIRCDTLAGAAFLGTDAAGSGTPGAGRSDSVRGTKEWTRVERRFRTGDAQQVLSIWAGCEASTGTARFDDLSLVREGVDSANLLPDPGFERQFMKDDAGNDPEDPATARALPKGTQINQWAAFELDGILDAAAREGIAVQLCAHGDVYWTWDATVYESRSARENGYTTGWLDPAHLGYWKRNLRYRIARWGSSTALLAWEIWNEHGNIGATDSVALFYRELAAFARVLDAHRHLFTTSQGSQTHSADFWYGLDFDLINYHDYITTALDRHSPALRDDDALFVYRLASDLAAQRPANAVVKPFVWGEIGTLRTWDNDDPVATEGLGGQITRHNFLWAGLFSPLLTSPIDWQAVEKATHTRALRRYFQGEPFDTAQWRTVATRDLDARGDDSVTVQDARLRVMALVDSGAQRILAWVQNRQHTWARVARDGQQPEAAAGTITFPRLAAGSYDLQWWNTRDTAAPQVQVLAHGGGAVTVALPIPIRDDIAMKIVHHASTTELRGATRLPLSLQLAVHPHPVAGASTLSFVLAEAAFARVTLHDALGRLLATCSEAEWSAGEHLLPLDTRGFAPGVYQLRVQAGQRTELQSIVIVPR